MRRFFFLISFSAYAGFMEAPGTDLYKYESPKKKVVRKQKKLKRKNKTLDQILKQDQEIAEILKRSEKDLIVKKSPERISALTRVNGIVLNSILAMNVRPTKFIVRINDDLEEIEGGELRCLGFSFEKRIPAKCDLLVVDGETFKVDVEIWDLDGAEGIIADYYYSGEEKTFLTSSFASFLQGTLDVSKDRLTTPFGEVSKNNAKNKMLRGLMGIASNANEKVVESGEKVIKISYVNSGKEVLVFFNSSLKLSKDER